MALSRGQQYALVLLPKVSGSISMIFSSLILYAILVGYLRRRRESAPKRNNHHSSGDVYQRLILAMSVTDILGSFWMFLSTWPIPEETGLLWAVGTQATCNLQGVFTQGATIASALYTTSLTFYFLLVARFQWKPARLRQSEGWFHVVPIVWGVATGIAGIPLELYNNANLWCYIAESPANGRGENADMFRMLFFYGPLYAMILIVTINVSTIIHHVQRITGQTMRSMTQHNTNAAAALTHRQLMSLHVEDDGELLQEDEEEESGICEDTDDPSQQQQHDNTKQAHQSNSTLPLNDNTTIPTTNNNNNRYIKWRRRVAHQSLRFALAFYFTWLPISMVRMLQLVEKQVPYWLIVLATITTPMQGLSIFLIHFYPAQQKQSSGRWFCGGRNFLDWIRAGMIISHSNHPLQQQNQNQLPTRDSRRVCHDLSLVQKPPPALLGSMGMNQDNKPASQDETSPHNEDDTHDEEHDEEETILFQLNVQNGQGGRSSTSSLTVSEYEHHDNNTIGLSSITIPSALETIHEGPLPQHYGDRESNDKPLSAPLRWSSEDAGDEDNEGDEDEDENNAKTQGAPALVVNADTPLSLPRRAVSLGPVDEDSREGSMSAENTNGDIAHDTPPTIPQRSLGQSKSSSQDEAYKPPTSRSRDSFPSLPMRVVSGFDAEDDNTTNKYYQDKRRDDNRKQMRRSFDSLPALLMQVVSEYDAEVENQKCSNKNRREEASKQQLMRSSFDSLPSLPMRVVSEIEAEDGDEAAENSSKDIPPTQPSRFVSEAEGYPERNDDDEDSTIFFT